jgi:L-lactate utilization protein LutC
MPEEKNLEFAVANIKEKNINVEVLKSKEEALARIREMIPDKASVMAGGSTTLDEIGFTKILKSGKHKWNNLKEKILSEKDSEKQAALRRKSVLADYYLGSVHAVSLTGEIVIASATGSQLPAYVFSSPHVIWVVGAQKITPDLEMAIERVREYVFPLEDERMKKEGQVGSLIGKMVIFEKEFVPGRITMLLVKEKLGF